MSSDAQKAAIREWLSKHKVRGVWPEPGVPTAERARAVAKGYRDMAARLQEVLNQVRVLADDPAADEAIRKLLAEVPPSGVEALDQQYFEWGEQWHVSELLDMTFDDDDWVPTSIAMHIARLAGPSLGTHRGDGLIPAQYLGPQPGFVYRVGDLRKHREGAYRPERGPGSAGGRPGKYALNPKYD